MISQAKVPCNSRERKKVLWPVIRISRRFAAELIAHFCLSGTIGHHEAITYSLCKSISWCTIETFPSSPVGQSYVGDGLTVGSWGKFLTDPSASTLENLSMLETNTTSPMPNRLYHPVKCESDENLGIEAMVWAGLIAR